MIRQIVLKNQRTNIEQLTRGQHDEISRRGNQSSLGKYWVGEEESR